jgi:hypothetical protein
MTAIATNLAGPEAPKVKNMLVKPPHLEQLVTYPSSRIATTAGEVM